MTSYLTRSNNYYAVFAGFVAGSVVTLLGVWLNSANTATATTPRQRKDRHNSNKNDAVNLPPGIREEQLSRHTLYFGQDGMERLKDASIVVVGVGGVGSHIAHMLGRAGVGHLRLIDFDQVSVSSLNRHACATLADVGTPKVTCMKLFLEKICPDPKHLLVEEINEMFTAENGERLLQHHYSSISENGHQPSWTMVIDAIDDVPTKAALLAQCLRQNIRVMSCMGAGGKADVTRLHISDLRTAAKDPLATKLRQHLKKLVPPATLAGDYLEDQSRLSIVYSSEKPVVKLADFTPEQKAQGVHEFGAVDGMRIRVVPVLGTMPAVMGQTLAAMALTEIGGKPMMPVPGERLGRTLRHRMFQHVNRREESLMKQALKRNNREDLDPVNLPIEGTVLSDGTWVGPLNIDMDDISYLVELWLNRCAVTGKRMGTVMELVRWDTTRPANCNNFVLMSHPALKKFDAPEGGKDPLPADVKERIENVLQRCNANGYYGDD